ncbi:hypothetical protein BKA61DRAFT_582752 [Leptodontidium sp. MPI-SDFR-AT-0119]|nr:hypothetical protein BKA61DRAFT_582752 [Leptodontidium sp. MPI-SDFR-AT-0119]
MAYVSLKPTFFGKVASTQDALIVFEACLQGVLTHALRSPHNNEEGKKLDICAPYCSSRGGSSRARTRRGRMERVVEDSTLTRQSRRERTKTPKALELEKRRHGGKSVNGNLFGTLSQRLSAAKDWDESNESDTDDVIEVRDGTPDAPRPNRTRRRPKNLSHASTRESTRTEEAEGGLLSTILSAIEEVKASNVELIVELAEVKA